LNIHQIIVQLFDQFLIKKWQAIHAIQEERLIHLERKGELLKIDLIFLIL